MDDKNVYPEDEQEQEDVAPEEEQEEVPEEVDEDQEQEQEAEEQPEPEQEEEEEPAEDEPAIPVSPQDSQGDFPDFDITKAVNEDGTVNLAAFQEWGKSVKESARAAAARQYQQMSEENRQWDRVYTKYPQVKENKMLRNLIHKQRIGNVYAGGKNDLVKAADSLFQHIQSAENQGKAKARTSIRRQRAAHLETSSQTSDTSQTRRRELMSQIDSRNEAVAQSAREELIKEMIDSGDITI